MFISEFTSCFLWINIFIKASMNSEINVVIDRLILNGVKTLCRIQQELRHSHDFNQFVVY